MSSKATQEEGMFSLCSQSNRVGRLCIVWFDWYVLIAITWYFNTLQNLSCRMSRFHSLSSRIFVITTIGLCPKKVSLVPPCYDSAFWFWILFSEVLLESDENYIWVFYLPQCYVCALARGSETQYLIFILRFKHNFHFKLLRHICCGPHLHFAA